MDSVYPSTPIDTPLSDDSSRVQAAINDPRNLLPVEAVEKLLNRSRASIYRYSNTDPVILNPPFDAKRLNAEIRNNKEEPLLFHPNEVARFAREVLGIKQIAINIQEPPDTATQVLLKEILTELRNIRELLQSRS
ncbi:MAG: resolvase [Leptolyngbyaceae cyanobacterium MO_188.B28]|nr:resolvase [Leptolyngbyaceae cyanobacterium MO_188.B28]